MWGALQAVSEKVRFACWDCENLHDRDTSADKALRQVFIKLWTMSTADNFYSTLIINFVLNSFLCFTATAFNLVTILALRKLSSSTLPRNLRTKLLSLAVSDLGVGLFVQPLNTARLFMMIEQKDQTRTFEITSNIFYLTGNFLFYSSFFGVMALTIDRFLAIRLHLRYQELVTHKRIAALVTSIVILSLILTLLVKWSPRKIYSTVTVAIEFLCYITTVFFYVKIYLALRHHKNQIHALQAQQAQNRKAIANAARDRKAAVGTFYLYLVFVVCYLPITCHWVTSQINGPSAVLGQFRLYASTMVLFNSSLNPMIYCWKLRHVRHAIRSVLPC